MPKKQLPRCPAKKQILGRLKDNLKLAPVNTEKYAEHQDLTLPPIPKTPTVAVPTHHFFDSAPDELTDPDSSADAPSLPPPPVPTDYELVRILGRFTFPTPNSL